MKKLTRMLAAALCAALLFSFASFAASGVALTGNSAGKGAGTENTAGNGKKIYFAGPMFNQAEKSFNLEITELLEECGYEVFLPQRDGIEAALLEGKTEEEITEMIFALDAEQVRKADILFMNLDGRVPDEGACVELGIAYAAGKRCYGFKTDTRAVEQLLEVNPMITGCMIRLFKSYDGEELKEEIRKYLAENEL